MKDIRRISLRLPDEVYQKLKEVSKESGNGLSSIIRTAITEYLK